MEQQQQQQQLMVSIDIPADLGLPTTRFPIGNVIVSDRFSYGIGEIAHGKLLWETDVPPDIVATKLSNSGPTHIGVYLKGKGPNYVMSRDLDRCVNKIDEYSVASCLVPLESPSIGMIKKACPRFQLSLKGCLYETGQVGIAPIWGVHLASKRNMCDAICPFPEGQHSTFVVNREVKAKHNSPYIVEYVYAREGSFLAVLDLCGDVWLRIDFGELTKLQHFSNVKQICPILSIGARNYLFGVISLDVDGGISVALYYNPNMNHTGIPEPVYFHTTIQNMMGELIKSTCKIIKICTTANQPESNIEGWILPDSIWLLSDCGTIFKLYIDPNNGQSPFSCDMIPKKFGSFLDIAPFGDSIVAKHILTDWTFIDWRKDSNPSYLRLTPFTKLRGLNPVSNWYDGQIVWSKNNCSDTLLDPHSSLVRFYKIDITHCMIFPFIPPSTRKDNTDLNSGLIINNENSLNYEDRFTLEELLFT